MKPGDRAVIWRERYCEEPKWAGRNIRLADKPYRPFGAYIIGERNNRLRGKAQYFVRFHFEDELNDPEREMHTINFAAIQKIKNKETEIGCWNHETWKELNWRPVE